MRAYVMTTGVIFGLLTVMHIWRAVSEGRHLASEPIFLSLTLLSAVLCLWAVSLIVRSARS